MSRLIITLVFLTGIINISAAGTRVAQPIDDSSLLLSADTGRSISGDSRVSMSRTPLQDEISEKTAAIEMLRAALQEQRAKFAELQSSLGALEKKQEGLIRVNDELTEKKKTLTEQKDTLTTQLAEAAKLTAKTADLDAQNQLLTRQLAEKEALVDQHHEEAATIARLEERVKAAEAKAAQTDDTEELKKAKEAEHAKLQSTLGLREKEAEALKAQIEALIADRTESSEEEFTETSVARLTKDNEDLAQRLAEVAAENKALKENQEAQAAQDHVLAKQEWADSLHQVKGMLTPSIDRTREVSQTVDALIPKAQALAAQHALLIKKHEATMSGQRVALEKVAALQKEKTELEEKLATLKDYDTKYAALEKEKLALEEAIKTHLAAIKKREDTIEKITAQRDDLAIKLKHLEEAMERLQATELSPAAQLKAQLITQRQVFATQLEQMMRQLSDITKQTSLLEQQAQKSKTIEDKSTEFSRAVGNLIDDIKEFIALTRTAPTGKASIAELQETIKKQEEKIESLTSDYDKLVKEANDRVAALQAQITALQQEAQQREAKLERMDALQSQIVTLQSQTSQKDETREELEKLQRQLQKEKEQRDAEALIDRKFKDEKTAADLALLQSRQMQDQLDESRREHLQAQITNESVKSALTVALQAGAQAAAAAAATSIQTFPTSIADYRAQMPQMMGLPAAIGGFPTPAMTSSMISSMPSQYHSAMSGLSSLPYYYPPTSMQQVGTMLSSLTQNHSRYKDIYKKVIQSMMQALNERNKKVLDSLERDIAYALRQEAVAWKNAVLRNRSMKQTAIQKIGELLSEITTPLIDLERRAGEIGAIFDPSLQELAQFLRATQQEISQIP